MQSLISPFNRGCDAVLYNYFGMAKLFTFFISYEKNVNISKSLISDWETYILCIIRQLPRFFICADVDISRRDSEWMRVSFIFKLKLISQNLYKKSFWIFKLTFLEELICLKFCYFLAMISGNQNINRLYLLGGFQLETN